MNRYEPSDAEITAAAIDNLACADVRVHEYTAAHGDRPHWLALLVRYKGQKLWMLVGQRHRRMHLLQLARKARRPTTVWID